MLRAAAALHPRFAAAAQDADSPLLDLAVLVGEGLDTVELEAVERQMEFYAFLVGRAVGGRSEPRRRLAGLREVLCGEEGFHGESEQYDDPLNSFLGQVIGRKRGLPIALSVVYLAVAQRLGWPLVGIDFPVHFLLRYLAEGELLVIDPFHGGRLLEPVQCLALARPAFASLPPVALGEAVRQRLDAVVDSRRIADRMLRNLELSYLRREDWSRVRNVLEKRLLLHPGAVVERRDLGRILELAGEPRRALECLESYLHLSPGAADRGEIEAAAERIRRQLEDGRR